MLRAVPEFMKVSICEFLKNQSPSLIVLTPEKRPDLIFVLSKNVEIYLANGQILISNLYYFREVWNKSFCVDTGINFVEAPETGIQAIETFLDNFSLLTEMTANLRQRQSAPQNTFRFNRKRFIIKTMR